MAGHRLQLHDFAPVSFGNGPGPRSVIWVQGCSLECPGCFNPETHLFEQGAETDVDELFERIRELRDGIEGITISGGEPLDQPAAISHLIRRISSETSLSVIMFTGYTIDEIDKMPDSNAVHECVDVLIAGRYDRTQPLARDLRGSSNKQVHFFTERYSVSDLSEVPVGEIIIGDDGSIVITGIDPVSWQSGGEQSDEF